MCDAFVTHGWVVGSCLWVAANALGAVGGGKGNACDRVPPMSTSVNSDTPMPSAAFAELPMVTLKMSLIHAGHELALALPEVEWTNLVSNFVKMPADERQRVGASIRHATSEDPFPMDGSPVGPADQEKCDVFVSDCILLAALAEASGKRVLTETVVDKYQIVRGNLVKGHFN